MIANTKAMPALERSLDQSESIHRLDTIPPPDGEDDAYSAATKVGPLSGAQVAALMGDADDAPPVSTAQMRRSRVTAEPILIEIEIPNLSVVSDGVRQAPQAPPAPATLQPTSGWQPTPPPTPLAPSVPSASRGVRSSTSLVVAIIVATGSLAIFAAGVTMFLHVFFKV